MRKKTARGIKNEIKIIGIDDAPFVPRSLGVTRLFGIIIRGSTIIEGVVQTTVEIDGWDGTEKIIEMVTNSKHYKQIKVIMLAGITVGGFNVLDIKQMYKETHKPVIVVIEKQPDFESIKLALQNLPRGDEKWNLIQKFKEVNEIQTLPDSNPIYYQYSGIIQKNAERIIKLSTNISRIPEPIRIAHLIGRSFL
ncbi:MAG: DUF99 family protein [Promethearchaeota archaeon]